MKFHNLHDFSGITVDPKVEEAWKDIYLAIEYNDHGDDFLFIENKNGDRFEYGYFLSRYGYPDYDELDLPWYENWFVRKPELYKNPDKNSKLSNDIYWDFHRLIQDRRTSRSLKPYDPQWNFNRMLDIFKDAYRSDIIYNWTHRQGDLMHFLIDNKIDTPENIRKLRDAKLRSSRVNGADGVAGKKTSGGYIICDRLHFVCLDGKCIKLSKVKKEIENEDEWGFSRICIDVDQFKSTI